MRAERPDGEDQRLDALRSYAILDTAPEPAFDQIAAQAAELFDSPIALVSLVDEDRQWFKARIGLDFDQTDRDQSFCAHALGQATALVVPDATLDVRFADNPLVVGEPMVRSYAGAQIRTRDGHALGTVCVLDQKSRTFSETQVAALRLLGAEAATLLRIRRQLAVLVELSADAEQARSVVREAEVILSEAQRRRGQFLIHLADRVHGTFTIRMTRTQRVESVCLCGWTSAPTGSAGVAGALWDTHRRAER